MQYPLLTALTLAAPLLLACGSPESISEAAQQDATDLLQIGRQRYEEGDATGAIASFTDAIERNPNNPLVYANRGGVLAAQSDFTAAIADYSCAIELEPELAGAYGGRGLAHYHNGDSTAGVEDLWQAAQLFRDQGEMNSYRATMGIIQRLEP